MINAPCYLIFGPQGSGKSTQAELLSTKLNLPYFDSGSELRHYAANNNLHSPEIHQIMQSGQLVPNQYLEVIIKSFMSDHNCSNGLVIDGFPRNITQTKLFEKMVAEFNWRVTAFYVAISDQTAKDRLAIRHTLVDGRKVFRDDDRPAIVQKRLDIFKKETLPVINWLMEKYEMIKIDGEPSREEVFKSILNQING